MPCFPASRTFLNAAKAHVRAAVAPFGFVYIRQMANGNGRISRFLINDILRRDGLVPAPIILPISATIADSTQARAAYDKVLERFSHRLMRKYASLSFAIYLFTTKGTNQLSQQDRI
ncbi:hypothetical protein [Janthinobacterium sp. B9-8]|uniref:hypothetical protein n=1 Tax=Janthinobacterium sp. B9-8 TaxID=1236179 RepID=UPI00061CECCA|nr:hypothetical protein VN23_03700 [Janthinobacterium sp. B9-8]